MTDMSASPLNCEHVCHLEKGETEPKQEQHLVTG